MYYCMFSKYNHLARCGNNKGHIAFSQRQVRSKKRSRFFCCLQTQNPSSQLLFCRVCAEFCRLSKAVMKSYYLIRAIASWVLIPDRQGWRRIERKPHLRGSQNDPALWAFTFLLCSSSHFTIMASILNNLNVSQISGVPEDMADIFWSDLPVGLIDHYSPGSDSLSHSHLASTF